MANYEFPPLGGGSGNATYHLLRQLARFPGVRVDLVTSSATNDLETVEFSQSIRLFQLPVGKAQLHYWTTPEIARWFLRSFSFTRELTRRNDYDLCHCWSGWPSGVIGYSLRKRLPYLLALRGSDVPGYNPRLKLLDPVFFRPLSRIVWSAADAVTCVSPDLAGLAGRTASGLSPEVIGNGVDTIQFRSGEKPARFTILYVGRLIPRKGVIHVLRALAELWAEGADCRFVVAGSGPERARLARFCRVNGIETRVEFLGEVPHAELPELYARASLFVMPALREASSNAVLEAMASGLAVVTTRTGNFDLLDDNGIVVDQQDPRQIKAAIETYMRDEELLRRHGDRSRNLAEKRTWSGMARAYLELYDRILEREDSRLEEARA